MRKTIDSILKKSTNEYNDTRKQPNEYGLTI